MLSPDYPVHTDRLLLRPMTAEDIDPMLRYKSRPEVVRFVPYGPLTRADIAERISGRWGRTELTEPGQSVTLALEERETGRLVGDAVLFWHSAEHRSGEVGYILSPDATGHGYATEAATAILRLGFDELGLHRMVARLDERNTASARVAERLGMRLEARLVQNEWFKGEWSTELVFAMLEDEWRASPLR
ncbi:RimJ/RimL family protein N-acetyltransferase [Arthrobacter woluwensis]|uniref:GNAT family N-acetyltransferase n=1 Tax=Arthrobacter woluwensis TaxID=156980 RepID=UPI002780EEA9|nr:GNAT family N-acetyltransferase [Arthrobacter woluwensis]MDQ0708420.1 RimJ/RimL family protein N-acetyltransferase [Arthrobacter woluwensis]